MLLTLFALKVELYCKYNYANCFFFNLNIFRGYSNLYAFCFFPALLYCLGPPAQGWMQVVRMDILSLLLILGENHSICHH